MMEMYVDLSLGAEVQASAEASADADERKVPPGGGIVIALIPSLIFWLIMAWLVLG